MLAQREHDYFAETVICANCYIVAKNKPHILFYELQRERTSSRHCSMSHLGVEVAPQMPSVEIPVSIAGVMSLGPSTN